MVPLTSRTHGFACVPLSDHVVAVVPGGERMPSALQRRLRCS